jgi:hypothetical protein
LTTVSKSIKHHLRRTVIYSSFFVKSSPRARQHYTIIPRRGNIDAPG